MRQHTLKSMKSVAQHRTKGASLPDRAGAASGDDVRGKPGSALAVNLPPHKCIELVCAKLKLQNALSKYIVMEYGMYTHRCIVCTTFVLVNCS